MFDSSTNREKIAVPKSHFRTRLRTAVRLFTKFAAALAILLMTTTVIYRFIDPPGSTLMLARTITGKPVTHKWVPISRISPNIIKAVITSEDGRFCDHWGVDWQEVRRAIKRARNGRIRGASTISMQTAKNLYLWPQRSYIRKAIEIPLTFFMEAVWSKRRMLEIYLNIVEWGPGIFGAEAASKHHFRKSARHISPHEASLLAAALPNPILRRAGRPGPKTTRHSNKISSRVSSSPPSTNCIFKK